MWLVEQVHHGEFYSLNAVELSGIAVCGYDLKQLLVASPYNSTMNEVAFQKVLAGLCSRGFAGHGWAWYAVTDEPSDAALVAVVFPGDA